jgi:hypothetical protein
MDLLHCSKYFGSWERKEPDLEIVLVPPTSLSNARLQGFIQQAFTKVAASINEKLVKFQEIAGGLLDYYRKYHHAVIEVTLSRIADLLQDVRSLYQWIREQDKEISQEEALKYLLHTLISFWLSVYLFQESHQRGFRNLLLDGWWLEFWEIILLAAGDVERNPGPRQLNHG